MRPEVAAKLMLRGNDGLYSVTQTVIKRQQEANKATILQDLESSDTETQNLWRRGEFSIAAGDDGQSLNVGPASLASRDYGQKVNRALDAGLITGHEAAKLLENHRLNANSNVVLGEFDRTIKDGGRKAGETFLTSFMEADKSLDPATRDRLFSRMRAELARLENEDRAAVAGLKEEAKAAIEIWHKGGDFAGGDALIKKAQAIDPDTAKALVEAQDINDFTRDLSKLPPSDQAKIAENMASLRNVESTAPEAARMQRRYEAAVKLAAYSQKALEDAPWAFAQSQGVIKPTPLNLDDPATMQARIKEQAFVREYYKLPELNLLTREEQEGFKRLYDKADAAGKTRLLGQAINGFGDKSEQFLWQIGDERPVAAHAGSLYKDGLARAAQDMLKGEDILKSPELKALYMPKGGGRKELGERLKGVFPAFSPEFQEGVLRSIEALYAERARQANKENESVYDPDILAKSIDDVTGGVISYKPEANWGGSALILAPTRGMTASQFVDVIKELKPEDLPPGVDVRIIRRHGVLESLGHARYGVKVNGLPIFTEDGKPFVLDLNPVVVRFRWQKPGHSEASSEDWLSVP